MDFVGTVWALLPPIIAIALALMTKEVYLSLFVGILTGSLLYTGFRPIETVETIFSVMMEKLGDPWNIGILIFLVFLGMIVALMTRAGGSAAYGKWANSKIKTKSGALLSTFGLGAMIFVDDYFNCLTVGNVMRPLTGRPEDSPVLSLPISLTPLLPPSVSSHRFSSWAAAVTGYTQGDGFSLFLQTIPFNLYAWLTILMVVYLGITGFDYGPMKKFEEQAKDGDLFGGKNEYENVRQDIISPKGKVIDLVLPVLFLIISCIVCMIYTGGFFEGETFINAFANCNASMGLVLGSFFTLIFVFLLYLPRKVISFQDFAECIPQGFKMMVSAILILVLAWTLGGFCSTKLEAGAFVYEALHGSSVAGAIFPAILFLIGTGLAFATGTSWGTFGILIPIVIEVFPPDANLLVISIAAVLAGSVCGDHISPISDTTIMASAGAQCNHVNHVTTQLPYALTVAGCCFVSYIVAGITENVILTLLCGVTLLFLVLTLLRRFNAQKQSETRA